MNKLLKLLVDDYYNQKTSAELKLTLRKLCEAQTKFIDSLNDAQKKEFMQLDSITGEHMAAERNEFANYLFEHLSKILK